MSGIIGYLGHQKASIMLTNGLERLDYRGYDSAGIAVVSDHSIEIRKTEGRIADLRNLLLREPVEGTVGIGHTRWATHGNPSQVNAHPLADCTGRLALVHNGIIDNYRELKDELIQRGHVFQTDTDTEVVAHLLEEHNKGDLVQNVREVLPIIQGSYAMAIISAEEPQTIVIVRKDNPVVIGYGKDEYFFASDAPALSGYASEYYPLRNQHMAIMTPAGVIITDFNGKPYQSAQRRLLPKEIEAVFENQYPHYMLKEIMEQPNVLRATLKHRLTDTEVQLPEIDLSASELKHLRRVIMVACGTSYHAALVGQKTIEKLNRLDVDTAIASEFRYDTPNLDPIKDLIIVVSQSGETADSLAALREAQKTGAKVIAVTNTNGSSIAREADFTLFTYAGPELAVASTKTYSAAITTLILFGIWLAQKLGHAEAETRSLIQALKQLPEDVSSTLIMTQDAIDQYASITYDQDHIFLIGRGLDRAVALEGSLKLQQVAYIHSDAYAAGEMKHGTLALIVKGAPVIVLATNPDTFQATLGNIKEIKARNAFVMGITVVGEESLSDSVDEVLYIPSTHPLLMPLLAVLPLQMLAYYTGVMRNNDVDKPRNLAKSVTVE